MAANKNMKVNITFNEELMKRADAFAEKNYLSRSGLFTLAVTQYLNANEITNAINEMALCMRKIADNNAVDDETMEQLKDFERIANLLMPSR